MSTWYTTADETRLLAAWRDAPIENLEVCAFILEAARDQVLAYAPAVIPTTYEPVTVTFDGGEEIVLSRVDDVVTAVIHPRQDAVRMNPASMPLPELFGVAGGSATFFIVPEGVTAPSWQLQVAEQGAPIILPFGAFGTVGPYSPNPATVKWIADPAPGDGIPARYVYAQLQQAKNLLMAGSVARGGEYGDGEFTYEPRPLDKAIKNLIRPVDGKSDVY